MQKSLLNAMFFISLAGIPFQMCILVIAVVLKGPGVNLENSFQRKIVNSENLFLSLRIWMICKKSQITAETKGIFQDENWLKNNFSTISPLMC